MASRQFSLPTVLRMVPNALIKECFEVLGHSEFDPRWPDLKRTEIEPILDYFDEIPVAQLNQIESVLYQQWELAMPNAMTPKAQEMAREYHAYRNALA